MRQITRDSVNAFRNKRNFKRQNMSVQYLPNLDASKMYLHGNLIAIYKHNTGELAITNAGWCSVTTKERLNGIIDSMTYGVKGIYQKDWQWYLNGNTWDGNLTVISSDEKTKEIESDPLAERYYNIIKNM